MTAHKTFISFYHRDDSSYKDQLVSLGRSYDIFTDQSVEIGDIDVDGHTDEQIRRIIRDDFIKDSNVTIVLVGENTRYRKHVDWEIGTTMIDGSSNAKGGIVVIYLPGFENSIYLPPRLKDQEGRNLNIKYLNWHNVDSYSLREAINSVFNSRKTQNYDTSRPFRKRNN